MESQRQEGTNKSAMRRIGAQEDSGKGRLRGAQEGSVMREGSETGTGRSSGTAVGGCGGGRRRDPFSRVDGSERRPRPLRPARCAPLLLDKLAPSALLARLARRGGRRERRGRAVGGDEVGALDVRGKAVRQTRRWSVRLSTVATGTGKRLPHAPAVVAGQERLHDPKLLLAQAAPARPRRARLRARSRLEAPAEVPTCPLALRDGGTL